MNVKANQKKNIKYCRSEYRNRNTQQILCYVESVIETSQTYYEQLYFTYRFRRNYISTLNSKIQFNFLSLYKKCLNKHGFVYQQFSSLSNSIVNEAHSILLQIAPQTNMIINVLNSYLDRLNIRPRMIGMYGPTTGMYGMAYY